VEHPRGEIRPNTLEMPHDALALVPGTVDLLILRALQTGPAHGYTITRWVRERTDGVLTIEDAALYQALHRLEAKGSVAAEWGLSDNNRRAKYYSLTPEGRQQLRKEIATWKRYSTAMLRIVEPA
jgi:PadR family transcriptional regulator, regulatory protein PadR